MHHSEKARLKRESHVGVGYECGPAVATEDESYFYSSYDGLFRKHVFRENDAFIQLVTSHDYMVATAPVVVEVEPDPIIVEVTPEPVAIKAAPKKKPGRKKKNAE